MNKSTWMPLSHNQGVYWLGRNGTALCRLGVRLIFEGAIEPDMLERALNIFIERQPMLRTEVSSWLPRQRVRATSVFQLETRNICGLTPAEKKDLLNKQYIKLINKPLSLPAVPKLDAVLYLVEPALAELQIATAHIAADGYSLIIMYYQLRDIYNALYSQKPVQENNIKKDYFDFVTQDKAMSKEDLLNYKKFWQDYVGDTPLWKVDKKLLATAEERKRSKASKYILAAAHIDALQEFCNKHVMGITHGFLAVLGLALYSLNKPEQIIIDCIEGGHNRRSHLAIAGTFEKHNFVKLNFNDNVTLSDYLLAVKKEVLKIRSQQNAPSLIKWAVFYSKLWRQPMIDYKIARLINKLISLIDKSIQEEFLINLLLNYVAASIKRYARKTLAKIQRLILHKKLSPEFAQSVLLNFSILPAFAEPNYANDWGAAKVTFNIDLEALNQREEPGPLSFSLSRASDRQVELWMNKVLSETTQEKLIVQLNKILAQMAENVDINLARLI